MTLYEFRLLENSEQTALLHEWGVFIGKRKEEQKTIVLYQLFGFYVEVYYRKYRYYISHLHCFTTTHQLAPYLQQVDVQDLLKCV